jgi:predicted transcriptional regulator
MNLKKVKEILKAEVLCLEEKLEKEILYVGATDLMSDALCLLEANSLLLTGLATLQVIRTAEILDLAGVVFVRGKIPPQDVIEVAKKSGIPLLTTKYPMYEACGKLYIAGFQGKKVDFDI